MSPQTHIGSFRRRLLAAVAAAVLAALGCVYYLTYEPAPAVAIRWRAGVSWEQRAAIERAFRLVHPREQQERTIVYDLLDIRHENIRALLARDEIEDTGYIDRRTQTIPADAPYGRGWMWLGTRVPPFRTHGVVPGIIVACAAALMYAVSTEYRARRCSAPPG